MIMMMGIMMVMMNCPWNPVLFHLVNYAGVCHRGHNHPTVVALSVGIAAFASGSTNPGRTFWNWSTGGLPAVGAPAVAVCFIGTGRHSSGCQV